MCRFTSYIGKSDVFLKDVLSDPINSLIKQSHEAREGSHGINADGFGLAWYNPHINVTPGVFKSTQPAWNDVNLASLVNHIQSTCFLGHVRASTVGDVNQHNCHPFCFETYSFAHNGTIRGFDNFKKQIISIIDEDLFLHIKGNTDSEYFFFLIMHFLRRDKDMIAAVKNSINFVLDLQKDTEFYSRINIVVTNGDEFLVARFVSKDAGSLSLKYSINYKGDNIESILFSSEELDDVSVWNEVEDNHYIYINKNDMQMIVGAI